MRRRSRRRERRAAGRERGNSHHVDDDHRLFRRLQSKEEEAINAHSPDERIFSMSAALGEALPPSWACWEDCIGYEELGERKEGEQEKGRERRRATIEKAAAAD